MKLNKNLPNFIVVGTAKAGTSFILKYLRQHPDLFIPNSNELYFHSKLKNFLGPFDKNIKFKQKRNFKEYLKNFEAGKNKKIIGEIATEYLYSYKNSIKSIKHNIGKDVKIVIILRNPVERTFSHYRHCVSKFQEPLNFWDSINAQSIRNKKKWRWVYQYTEVSKYFEQVKAFKKNFNDVHIIIYEKLDKKPKTTINSLYKFLGVRKIHFQNLNDRINVKFLTKNKFITLFLNFLKIFEKKIFKKNKISDMMQNRLATNIKLPIKDKKKLFKTFFNKDVEKLEKFLKLNLSHWKY